jgi:hypothetical protein
VKDVIALMRMNYKRVVPKTASPNAQPPETSGGDGLRV